VQRRMNTEYPQAELIGFDHDAGLGGLLKTFGVFDDYRTMLSDHLTGILRRQHPDVVIARIELLSPPGCRVGGIQNEDKELIRVQDMDATLLLRATLHVAQMESSLDLRLVLKLTGLDETPKMESDMFVEKQTTKDK